MKKPYPLLLCTIVFCTIVFFLGGCKSPASPGDPTTIAQLYPLSYGNYWTYEQKTFNQDGTYIGKAHTTEITGTENYVSYPGYRCDFGDGSPATILFYNGSGLYSVMPGSFNPEPVLLIRYPMNYGEVFLLSDTTGRQSYQNIGELVFRGLNEPVTVPAGTFNCYHFSDLFISGTSSMPDTSETQELYFSPGVGLVQDKVYTPDQGHLKLFLQNDLTSYNVQ